MERIPKDFGVIELVHLGSGQCHRKRGHGWRGDSTVGTRGRRRDRLRTGGGKMQKRVATRRRRSNQGGTKRKREWKTVRHLEVHRSTARRFDKILGELLLIPQIHRILHLSPTN